MKFFCPTIVIRHRKEKLKKCSLHGLEGRKDFLFYSYPLKSLSPIENYILLSPDAPQILSAEDGTRGLLLLDATWKLAEKMARALQIYPNNLKNRESGKAGAWSLIQQSDAEAAQLQQVGRCRRDQNPRCPAQPKTDYSSCLGITECRSLPSGIKTAYPRRQDEPHGLASIEALYMAYVITGRNPEGLLDNYYWKAHFLEKNKRFIIVTT